MYRKLVVTNTFKQIYHTQLLYAGYTHWNNMNLIPDIKQVLTDFPIYIWFMHHFYTIMFALNDHFSGLDQISPLIPSRKTWLINMMLLD